MYKRKKILIFELNWLGDILFSIPFLRTIRQTYPDAQISCAVVPRYKALLENSRYVDNVYTLSDRNTFVSVWEKCVFACKIAKEKYDLCFLIKPSRTKSFIAKMAGIPERIGFEGKKDFLTKSVCLSEDEDHRAQTILNLAKSVTEVGSDIWYDFPVLDQDKVRIKHLLEKTYEEKRRIVVLNAGGNWDAKRWAADNFVTLAKCILSYGEDIEIVMTGAEKDADYVDDIVTRIADQRCHSVAGKTALGVLAALFASAELVVSADSGPIHLASAVGTPTVSLFGPTSPDVTGPLGKGRNIVLHHEIECAVPCYVDECDKSYKCMAKITPEEVFKAVKEELKHEDN